MVDLRTLSVVVGALALAPLLVLELLPGSALSRWRTDVRIVGAGLFAADVLLVVAFVLRG